MCTNNLCALYESILLDFLSQSVGINKNQLVVLAHLTPQNKFLTPVNDHSLPDIATVLLINGKCMGEKNRQLR